LNISSEEEQEQDLMEISGRKLLEEHVVAE